MNKQQEKYKMKLNQYICISKQLLATNSNAFSIGLRNYDYLKEIWGNYRSDSNVSPPSRNVCRFLLALSSVNCLGGDFI